MPTSEDWTLQAHGHVLVWLLVGSKTSPGGRLYPWVAQEEPHQSREIWRGDLITVAGPNESDQLL